MSSRGGWHWVWTYEELCPGKDPMGTVEVKAGRWGNGRNGTDEEAGRMGEDWCSGRGYVQRRGHSGEWRAQDEEAGRVGGDGRWGGATYNAGATQESGVPRMRRRGRMGGDGRWRRATSNAGVRRWTDVAALQASGVPRRRGMEELPMDKVWPAAPVGAGAAGGSVGRDRVDQHHAGAESSRVQRASSTLLMAAAIMSQSASVYH